MKLAVIPARGGSKRIPRKNVKLFCGKPMIVWSIEAAIASKCFDRVLVSTDDREIAQIARSHRAEVPFVRPGELADDQAVTVEVVAHAVQWCNENGCAPSLVCCIYATAPLVAPSDIREGLKVLEQGDHDYAFSVTSYAYPIQRALRVDAAGAVAMFNPELLNTRSQDLEEAYHDAGQFYWGWARSWINKKPILNTRSAAVKLPRYRVQDIDTLEDWQRAEYLFRAMANSEDACASQS